MNLNIKMEPVKETGERIQMLSAALERAFPDTIEQALLLNISSDEIDCLKAREDTLMPSGYTRERGTWVLKLCGVLLIRMDNGGDIRRDRAAVCQDLRENRSTAAIARTYGAI